MHFNKCVGMAMHQDSQTDYKNKLVLTKGKTLWDSDAIPEDERDIGYITFPVKTNMHTNHQMRTTIYCVASNYTQGVDVSCSQR